MQQRQRSQTAAGLDPVQRQMILIGHFQLCQKRHMDQILQRGKLSGLRRSIAVDLITGLCKRRASKLISFFVFSLSSHGPKRCNRGDVFIIQRPVPYPKLLPHQRFHDRIDKLDLFPSPADLVFCRRSLADVTHGIDHLRPKRRCA